jgi:hypothetical protein
VPFVIDLAAARSTLSDGGESACFTSGDERIDGAEERFLVALGELVDGLKAATLTEPGTAAASMTKYETPRTWLEQGRAERLPAAISDAFDDYVAALPLGGHDWTRLVSHARGE